MKIEHVFELGCHCPEAAEKGHCVEPHYIPRVTPGCEWVLGGEDEACRLWGKDGKTAPFVRATGLGLVYMLEKGKWLKTTNAEKYDKCGAAWLNLTKRQPKNWTPEWYQRFAGLYQLIDQEEECPSCEGGGGDKFEGREVDCGQCRGWGLISRPRLVRVGEEKASYLSFADLALDDILEYLSGHLEALRWHGILWVREVECPECEGKSQGYDRSCPRCHGSGTITEYAKVERRLMS